MASVVTTAGRRVLPLVRFVLGGHDPAQDQRSAFNLIVPLVREMEEKARLRETRRDGAR
jgi:hypothetical protein